MKSLDLSSLSSIALKAFSTTTGGLEPSVSSPFPGRFFANSLIDTCLAVLIGSEDGFTSTGGFEFSLLAKSAKVICFCI